MTNQHRSGQSKIACYLKTCAGIIFSLYGVSSANAEVFEVTIDAKSNIFYAGTDLTPYTQHCAVRNRHSTTGLGDGAYPPHIQLNSGLRAIQISSSNTANLSYSPGASGAPTPDGMANGSSAVTTSTNPSGTMPGLRFANRMGMLAAVFTDDTIVNSSSNVSLKTFNSTTMNAAVLNYGLRDTFYLGDGTVVDWPTSGGLPDGTQQRQTLLTPAGATKLFLGLTDAYAINGPNECFMDNTGGIIATLKMSISDDMGAVAEGIGGVAIADIKNNDYVTAPSNLISATAITPPAGSTEGAPWAAGITLNADGSVSVAPTVPRGEYKAWYELCDAATTPQSCMQALVTIDVVPQPLAPIEANPDSGAVTQSTGGTAIADIRKNDSLDGGPATAVATTVAPQGVWPSGIDLDRNTGAVTVVAGTPTGTYTALYRLCEVAKPANCVVTTVTVTVTADPVQQIRATDDNAQSVFEGFSGRVLDSVLGNDTVNSNAATLVTAAVSQVGVWPAGITLDVATGAVNVSSDAKAGTYRLPYRLCEIAAQSNCDTAFVTLTITAVAATTPVAVPFGSNWLLLALGLGLALVGRHRMRHLS